MLTLQELIDRNLEIKGRKKSEKGTIYVGREVRQFKLKDKVDSITEDENGIPISEIYGGVLDLTEWKNLVEISIDGRELKSPIIKVKFGNNHPKLVSVRLPYNSLGADFLEEIKKVKGSLKMLDITQNNISIKNGELTEPVNIEVF
ncbi:MAG: hypothetical protein MRERC_16c001, partial [Mycoplasmataceae bacterium RC_NB112A]